MKQVYEEMLGMNSEEDQKALVGVAVSVVTLHNHGYILLLLHLNYMHISRDYVWTIKHTISCFNTK